MNECVEWSRVEQSEEEINLRRNKQTHAHTHKHSKAIFWCERTGLCHSATQRCTIYMLCAYYESWAISFFSVLSFSLSLSACVYESAKHLRWWSIISECGKIDYKNWWKPKTMGQSGKINKRTNEMKEIIEQLYEMKWNACRAMLTRKHVGLIFFWARISGSEGSSPRSRTAAPHHITVCSKAAIAIRNDHIM